MKPSVRLVIAMMVAQNFALGAQTNVRRDWIITEVGAEFPIGSTGGHYPGASGDIDDHVVLTYGLMKNWTTAAMGITGSAMTTGAKSGARGEVRYRRWHRADVALKASGGIVHWAVPGTSSNRAEPATGVTGSIGIDRGWIGADARLDVLRAEGRTVSAFSVGAQLGQRPAKVIMVTALGLGLLLFLDNPG